MNAAGDRAGGCQQAEPADFGHPGANEGDDLREHVDDRNAELRLDPPDEGVGGIAGIATASAPFASRRLQVASMAMVGSSPLPMRLAVRSGICGFCSTMTLMWSWSRAAWVRLTSLCMKSTVAAGPTPPSTPSLNWCRGRSGSAPMACSA